MRHVSNVLAAIGLVCLVLFAYMYYHGWMVVAELDPKATQVISEFARKAIQSDVASASVIKMPLSGGVDMQRAVQAMKARAAALNVGVVSHLSFHPDPAEDARGQMPPLEILMLCKPDGAGAALLEYNRALVAYLPCRIALYEDDAGQIWLTTMNLDLLIHGGAEFDPELRTRVLAVKEALLNIMVAGAHGSG